MTGRGRRIVVLLATLIGVAATAWLGLWQLHRATEKEALQQAQHDRGALPVIGNGQLADTPELAEQQHYRLVRMTGRWISGATVFLDNRQMDGRPGFFVVTPLRLTGRADAVVVQRGWAPRNANDRSAVPAVVDSPGEVVVEGFMAAPPGRLYDFGSPGVGAIRQNLPLAAYSKEVGAPLLPLSIMQSDSAATAGDGLLRRWPAPDLGIERHYGYVFQWFALCALIAGLYVWFQLIKPALLKSRVQPLANPEAQLSKPRPGDA